MNIAFDVIAIAGIVVMFIVILQSFSTMPDRVPVHFDIAGKPDGWGSKNTFWIFPILGLFMYILLTVVSRFPHTFNYPWPITEQNAPQQYRLGIDLLARLKGIVICLLTFLEWQGIRVGLGTASGLGVVFLPVILLILFGTLGIYFWQAYQAR